MYDEAWDDMSSEYDNCVENNPDSVISEYIDKEIKIHYNELLKLQIEHQILQNSILKELYNNSVAVNYPIVKYNQLALNYQHMKSALTEQPKPIPFGMYT